MIKNIIFDVGNVLVSWSPHSVISSLFPQFDPAEVFDKMRPIWIELNLGKLSEEEAIDAYQKILNFSKEDLISLMHDLKAHQKPLAGSIELLGKLKKNNFNLYSITDNIKEFVEYHKKHSVFVRYFIDIIVSAEVGYLKPAPEIYEHLLCKHNLKASESIFIDDILKNVEGATKVGIKAFQFTGVKACEAQLRNYINI